MLGLPLEVRHNVGVVLRDCVTDTVRDTVEQALGEYVTEELPLAL